MVSGEVERFLSFLPARTAKTYRSGLELFERFYGVDALSFLSEVQADRGRPMLERKYVEREVLSKFAEWLVKRGAAPKTVHVYASAIQSFGKFKGVDISLKYIKMPSVHVRSVSCMRDPALQEHSSGFWNTQHVLQVALLFSLSSPLKPLLLQPDLASAI